MYLLPSEVWIKISLELNIGSYFSLAQTCRAMFELLKDPQTKKQWILKFLDGNYSDALVFSYRHRLYDVVDAFLRGSPPLKSRSRLLAYKDAFVQITCHDTSSLSSQEQLQKVKIIRKLLEDHCENEDEQYNSEIIENRTPFRRRAEMSAKDLAVMALRWCCHYAEHMVVRYLLDEYGLRVSSIKCYSTWWMRMLRAQRFDLVRMLLHHGATISMGEDQIIREPDIQEQVVIEDTHLLRPHSSERNLAQDARLYILRNMAFEGRLEAVDVLLQSTPEYQLDKDQMETALYQALLSAAMYNQEHLLSHLIKEYGVNMERIDPDATILWSAISHGHLYVIQQVFETIVEQQSEKKQHIDYPPLETVKRCFLSSVAQGHHEVIMYLFDKIGPYVHYDVEKESRSLLILACKTNRVETVKCLIQSGVSCHTDTFDVLDVIARFGSFDLIPLLMHEEARRR